MSADSRSQSTTSAALCAELERRLAAAEREVEVPREGYLGVATGARRFLLPLVQLAGLVTKRPITPLPTTMPGLLGVAGIRGEVLAAYDLAARLGHVAAASPTWLAVTTGPGRIGLAFERFTGHFHLAAADLDADPQARGTIVDVAGLVADIVRDVRRLTPDQEP